MGDPVYAVGSPGGRDPFLSEGVVARLKEGPPPYIQMTAAVSPGSSGGGLFDQEGRLVGLTTLGMEPGQNVNFAVPVEWTGDVRPSFKTSADIGDHIGLEMHAADLLERRLGEFAQVAS